jgi:hypothetical protein
MYGTEPVAIPPIISHFNAPAAENHLKLIDRFRQEALAAHELARRTMATRTKGTIERFAKGQHVWLNTKNLRINTATPRKFWECQTGPFPIEEVLGPITYQLKLPKQWRVHPVFHANLLSPFQENAVHRPNFIQPPPDLVNGDKEWEIEKILNHKGSGNR